MILVDTGFIVALFNEQDPYHKAAVDLDSHLGDDYQFVSTVFVFQEIYWFLSKIGQHAVLEFIGCVQEQLILLPPLPDQWLKQATTILKRYSDKKLDLADVSLAILADHLKLGDVASVDIKDFIVLKWNDGKKHFNNHMQSFMNKPT